MNRRVVLSQSTATALRGMRQIVAVGPVEVSPEMACATDGQIQPKELEAPRGMIIQKWLNIDWDALRDDLLGYSLYGNSALRWLAAITVAILVFLILRVVRRILQRRITSLGKRWRSDWPEAVAELLSRTMNWFLLIESLYLGSLVLILPARTAEVTRSIAVIVLLVQAAIWANTLLTFCLQRYVKRQVETDAAAVTTIAALGFLGRLVLWTLALLLGLANLGVDVTALVAGLGVGGIAVALAAQNILGDLFASLSIVLDKPFVLGDFIIVGEHMGSVERIGMKTTRIRSLSGEQLIFSNNDLLQSRIRNYKRMQQRRVVFSLGVTYDTPHDKLAAIPGMVREIIESQEQTRFDRAHFKEYGDFALKFEIVFYVLSADYNVYMDIQQAINLEVNRRFEQEAIDFAYPTQTLYLKRAQTMEYAS